MTESMVRAPSGPRRWILIDLLVVSVIVVIGVAFTLDVSSMRLPFTYAGDSLGIEQTAKTIIQTGWIQGTHRLGAPYEQVLYDYPIGGDHLHYLMMKVMSWGVHDWVLLVNGFYVLSFFTAAWSAYLCQRWLSVGRVAAVVTSTLFAFAPYHFARGISHLMLASYFVVPIGVLLAVKAADGTLFARASAPIDIVRRRGTDETDETDETDDRVSSDVAASIDDRSPGWKGHLRQIARPWPWYVLALIAGSCGAYYAVFTVLLVVIMSVASAASRRVWAPLVSGAALCALVGGMFVVNISQSILYRRQNGVNPAVAARTAAELDIYGLRPIQMLTPVPGHWLRPLADIAEDFSIGYPSEYMQFLGLVGAASLVWMLTWGALGLLRRERGDNDTREMLVLTTIVTVLIGITGGLAWSLTLVGFTEIRAWNRLSIVILFMALCWMGLTAGPLVRRWVHDRQRARPLAFGLAALVLVAGLTDQGSMDDRPRTDTWQDSFWSDRHFFDGVEASLPAGTSVYLLPYRRFPEEPAQFGSNDYDLFRPYLHTDTLRFSYGGMKGREADWQERLVDAPAAELVESYVAVGFGALVIDRYGYPDLAASLMSEFDGIIGTGPQLSEDGRWAFYDLADVSGSYDAAELDTVRRQLLETPRIVLAGCSGAEGTGATRFQWCAADIEASIMRSDGVQPAAVRYTFDVEAPAGFGTLVVEIGDDRRTIDVGAMIVPVELEAPAGVDSISIRAEVPALDVPGDPRDLRVRIIAPKVETSP